MKVALLGAVVAKRENWTGTQSPSDATVLRHLKVVGYFPHWELGTLKGELSKAWGWFRSEGGTKWFEREEARANIEATAAVRDEKVCDLT
jgi:hypothetical protein